MNQKTAIRWAGIVMFLGVAMGAFGAHGFEEILERNGRADVWNTAVKYHLIHGVALFALALSSFRAIRVPILCWLIGVLVFSGSLYALALSNVGVLGAITPIGGVLFLVGWAWIVIKAAAGSGTE